MRIASRQNSQRSSFSFKKTADRKTSYCTLMAHARTHTRTHTHTHTHTRTQTSAKARAFPHGPSAHPRSDTIHTIQHTRAHTHTNLSKSKSFWRVQYNHSVNVTPNELSRLQPPVHCAPWRQKEAQLARLRHVHFELLTQNGGDDEGVHNPFLSVGPTSAVSFIAGIANRTEGGCFRKSSEEVTYGDESEVDE